MDFYLETSMKTILKIIEQTKRTETQMMAKLVELIDYHDKQSMFEKENVDVNYYSTSTKKGRKRKLPLQQQLV